MSRLFFNDDNTRKKYFEALKTKSKLSWKKLSRDLFISVRQLRDWKVGKTSMSLKAAKVVEKKYMVKIPEKTTIKDDNWHMEEASRKGGKRRFELHGNPGTSAGRRKGGVNSLIIHNGKNTGFVVAKQITKPYKTEALSEIIGIFIGDGNLSRRQARISLNLKKDKKYAQYISTLIESVFKIDAPIFKRRYKSVLEIVVSGVNFVKYLNKLGLPTGDKIKQGLDIPLWIQRNEKFAKACLRGIFDTDGCTYVDTHRYKNKTYKHIGLAYTSFSPRLITSLVGILSDLGYTPTTKSKNRVFLRREDEVKNFFWEIRPIAERHVDTYIKFLEGYRSGYNGSASKAVV